MRDQREKVYQWLKDRLFCPGKAYGDELPSSPLDNIYYCGVLFPRGYEEEFDEVLSEKPETPGQAIANQEAATQRRRYQPPVAVGFSFLAPRNFACGIVCRAVTYTREPKGTAWQREELPEEESPFEPPSGKAATEVRREVLNGRGDLYTLWRPHREGWLVTVSLSNAQKPAVAEGITHLPNTCLFEVELACVVRKGRILEYPLVEPELQTDEEQELALRYRNKKIFGIGHGAAVDWDQDADGGTVLRVDWIPKFEAPNVTAELPEIDSEVLRIAFLKSMDDSAWQSIEQKLHDFTAAYGRWAAQQNDAAKSLGRSFGDAPHRILERQQNCLERMQEGLALLTDDTRARRAFQLAHEAMFSNMRSDRYPDPRWRPFQLAFVLMTLASVLDEDHPERETVDLIWFPTGGGKTEAYLGLIAIYIFYRRLRSPRGGGGTSVIMRYTLRLLTRQQFERASRLFSFMEIMRRAQPKKLGQEPISAGLWVGASQTPNTFKDASELASGEGDDWRELVIFGACPVCKTPFTRENVQAELTHFRLVCHHSGCDLHQHDGHGFIPVQTVDEGLYKAPPTLLFATIDKFANMAREEQARARSFFSPSNERMPPGLIIQDELHLVSGELGSVAALYEAGIDTALRAQNCHPKYIASTATIRNADRQVRQLYARKAEVFPAPGLDANDSFFMRTVTPVEDDPDTWGRLYVGALSWSSSWDARAAITPVIGAILSNPSNRGLAGPDFRDAWWTALIYHSSIAGLQHTRSLLDDAVPEYIDAVMRLAIQRADEDEIADAEKEWKNLPALGPDHILELWSGSTEIHQIQERLEQGLDADRSDGAVPDPRVSIALCTNMISVGMDIGRLSTMIVSGQPLTTAEYIQASSRVGRSTVPGVVVTHYLRNQPRSLSHYEGFRQYHEAMYRFVEPTSVAPFTPRCRARALPAALVIAMRYGAPGKLQSNEAANNFEPADAEIARVLELFQKRLRDACRPEESSPIQNHVETLVKKWQYRKETARKGLRYYVSNSNRGVSRLLCLFGEEPLNDSEEEWPVGTSMRSVDTEIPLRVMIPRSGGNRNDD